MQTKKAPTLVLAALLICFGISSSASGAYLYSPDSPSDSNSVYMALRYSTVPVPEDNASQSGVHPLANATLIISTHNPNDYPSLQNFLQGHILCGHIDSYESSAWRTAVTSYTGGSGEVCGPITTVKVIDPVTDSGVVVDTIDPEIPKLISVLNNVQTPSHIQCEYLDGNSTCTLMTQNNEKTHTESDRVSTQTSEALTKLIHSTYYAFCFSHRISAYNDEIADAKNPEQISISRISPIRLRSNEVALLANAYFSYRGRNFSYSSVLYRPELDYFTELKLGRIARINDYYAIGRSCASGQGTWDGTFQLLYFDEWSAHTLHSRRFYGGTFGCLDPQLPGCPVEDVDAQWSVIPGKSPDSFILLELIQTETWDDTSFVRGAPDRMNYVNATETYCYQIKDFTLTNATCP